MFNTDQFGTFSGEIERSQSPVDTLKAKCQLGFDVTACDLVIATEGSFGAHPDLPFCAAHDELILLMDFKNNVSFSARILTTETNFQGKKIKSEEELIAFGESIDFLAFRHDPRYSIVEIAPLLEQRVEPGRAPARSASAGASSSRSSPARSDRR